MSDLTLTGFPSGSVAAELRRTSDNGLIASVAGTVFADAPRWAPSPDFSGAAIYATRRGTDDPGDTRIYTGEGVVFGVDGLNAHAIMFCDYEWDFGGDDYEFEALDDPNNDIALWATNSGTAQGPYVGHTFRTAGIFTVTVNVYDHTRTLAFSDSIQITVLPASDLPTIYYDPTPGLMDAAAAHSAANIPGTTAADFRIGVFETALNEASGNVAKTRLLIKAGSEIELDRTVYHELDNIYIDTHGTGGMAKINVTLPYEQANPVGEDPGRQMFWATGSYVTFRNIHLKGSYNSVTPPVYAPWIANHIGFRLNNRYAAGVEHTTVDSCFIEGFEICFDTSMVGNSPWVLSNTKFTHWFAEAVFTGRTTRAAMFGCHIEQAEGTIEHPRITGADATPTRVTNLDDNNWHQFPAAIGSGFYATATGGGVRFASYLVDFGCHQCYVLCRSGWSDIGGEWSNDVGPVAYRGKRKASIQPAFRIMSGTNQVLPDGKLGLTSYSIWQVHAKGGSAPFVDTAGQPTLDFYTDSSVGGRGFVYNQCIAEGGWESTGCWSLMYGNTALRSCLGIIKTHAEWAGAEERVHFDKKTGPVTVNVLPDDGTPERNHVDVKTPVWALGCTFANEIPTRWEFHGWYGGVRPLHHRGCLALTVDVPATKTIRGEPDRPTGMVTFGGVLASTVATVPGAGASVLGDGFEFAPRRDIAGNLRPAAAAAGAYEGQS